MFKMFSYAYSTLMSSFSPPTLLLLTSLLCPLLWPFLFLSWPLIIFHIYSHHKLLHPSRVEPRKVLPKFLNPKNTQTTLIPHRGGSGSTPENTLLSYRLHPLNHIDLKKTLDNHVVCFHDQEPHERNMLKLTGRDVSLGSFDLCR